MSSICALVLCTFGLIKGACNQILLNKMFRQEDDILHVTLPEGKTQVELVAECKAAINELVATGSLYGKDVKLNGRLTTGMALCLGHALAHVCKSVSVFDPKENSYVVCVKH